MKNTTCRAVALIIGCAALFFNLTLAKAATVTNISGLFPTGAGGTNGLPDLHYRLILEPAGSPTNALVASVLPSSWIAAPVGSAWLSPYNNANSGAPQGAYTYRLTFDLTDSGGNALDPSSASIFFKYASDDYVSIFLNGVRLATTTNSSSGLGFGELYSLLVDDGFVAGANTLDFKVQNICYTFNTPTGLLVTDFCTSAELITVPEPGTWALLALGLPTFAVIFRSRRAARG